MMSKKLFLNKASRRATLGLMGLSLAGLLVSCNSHPVSFAQTENAIAVTQDRSPDSAASVDILWMIDNSGSMCEIQTSIRENFLQFIDQITAQNINFQMGVTTTDFSQRAGSEPLSRPGYLQAVPQPVPTSIARCRGTEGDPGDPMDGYKPVRTNIELAIACSKDPQKWKDQGLLNVTDAEIDAAYTARPSEAHLLFPTTSTGEQPGNDTPEAESPYRAIQGDNKLVLSSEDYRENGQLDVEALRADFACMSLVGTTGTGTEKGLAAAIHAVSPEMSGGTVEKPLDNSEEAPNYGLLRENANFALVMVTDENDCTDYGSFAGDTALTNTTPFYDEAGNAIDRPVKVFGNPCGDTACAIWNDPALADITPLISTEKLADRFKANLAASKSKEEINENTVVVTSIHGEFRRYGVSYPSTSDIDASIAAQPEADRADVRANIESILQDPNACEQSVNRKVENAYQVLAEGISCTITDENTTGSDEPRVAFSGDRYESFLRHFDGDLVLPKIPASETDHMPGLICDPASMGATLGEIGELIAGSTAQCIEEPPHECVVDEDCPAFAFGDATPTCRQFGRSDQKFCDSGLQMRLYPGTGDKAMTFADLQSNPYCMPESINSNMTPNGCVIDPSYYQISECAAIEAGINIEWVEEDSFDNLAGYSVELVYAVIPSPEEEANP